MNNTTIINTFNSDNSNITNINTKRLKIKTTITGIILKYKKMISKTVVTNLISLLFLAGSSPSLKSNLF